MLIKKLLINFPFIIRNCIKDTYQGMKVDIEQDIFIEKNIFVIVLKLKRKKLKAYFFEKYKF